MTDFEDLQDIVGDTVQPTKKAYGKTFETDYEEDDYLLMKKSMQSSLAQHRRYGKPVEVWTEAQKKMLADIDKLLARPIRVYEEDCTQQDSEEVL